MANLKSIKSKILSSKKMGTVTRAMEAVSAVKMRKSQERALAGRAYAGAALSILERLSGTADAKRHPLMREAEMMWKADGANVPTKKVAVVVITSDKGLAGPLNSGVIRRAEKTLVEKNLSQKNTVFICIGRRGAEYFKNKGYDVREKHENVSDAISESDVRNVTDSIQAMHESGEIEICLVVYQNFFSTFEQKPTVRQIVPITPALIRGMVDGIRPVRGKYAGRSETVKHKAPDAYTIEPEADTVLTVLLPKLLNIAIFHALLENKASEHSARMVAMKSATDKAKEMAQAFTRTFNKVRQAVITREVSEITSGIEAMK